MNLVKVGNSAIYRLGDGSMDPSKTLYGGGIILYKKTIDVYIIDACIYQSILAFAQNNRINNITI